MGLNEYYDRINSDMQYAIGIASQNPEHKEDCLYGYGCRKFPNGKVVFVSVKDIIAAQENKKNLLIICSSNNGGAYIETPTNNQVSFAFTSNQNFSKNERSKYYKVIEHPGEKIYMKTGFPADSIKNEEFNDSLTSIEQIQKNFSQKLSSSEIVQLRTTVDEERTANNLSGTLLEKQKKVIALIEEGILTRKAFDSLK